MFHQPSHACAVEEAASCGRNDAILTTAVKKVRNEGRGAQTNNSYSSYPGRINAAFGASGRVTWPRTLMRPTRRRLSVSPPARFRIPRLRWRTDSRTT